MKKRILLTLLAILSLPLFAWGQTTNVTLNATDTSGLIWTGGIYTAVLKPPPGQPPGQFFLNGVALTSNQITLTGTLNSVGSATFSVTSNTAITPGNTTWSFQVCYQSPINPCFFSTPFTITGGSQSVNLVPPPAVTLNTIGGASIPCAPQFSSTDTLTAAATSPTDTAFATICPIPAGTITPGAIIRGSIGVDWTSTTVPNFTLKVKLCTVPGCGSGTVIVLYNSAANPPTSGTFSSIMSFMIQGEAAPGASVTIAQSIGVGTGTNAPFGRNGTTTHVAGVPTNVPLYMQFTAVFSANTAGNSMTVTQLVFAP